MNDLDGLFKEFVTAKVKYSLTVMWKFASFASDKRLSDDVDELIAYTKTLFQCAGIAEAYLAKFGPIRVSEFEEAAEKKKQADDVKDALAALYLQSLADKNKED